MLGLSTSYYALKGLSIYDSVSRIIEIGFDTVELGAAHIYEENIWEILKEIKKQFPEILFILHTLFPPLKEKVWFNPAEGLTKQNTIIVDNLIKSATILGAPIFSIHPPVLNTVRIENYELPNGFYNLNLIGETDYSKAENNYYDLIRYINDRAFHNDLIVCLENLDNRIFNTAINSVNDYLKIFKKFSNFALLLDVGHALMSGELSELIKLKGFIRELHLHGIMDTNKGKLGHHLISDPAYFEPISEFLLDESIPIILEYGSHISEDDIIKEKQLIKNFILFKKGAIFS